MEPYYTSRKKASGRNCMAIFKTILMKVSQIPLFGLRKFSHISFWILFRSGGAVRLKAE